MKKQALLEYQKLSADSFKNLLALHATIMNSGLEERLLHLVFLRASQINGCAYCCDMHVNEAKTAGESDRRLHLVIVWRETSLFTERERAALAWTESVTLVHETHIPEHEFEALKAHFSDKEISDLTYAVALINAFNRLAISFHRVVE
ncbi:MULTISPECIES: carboxymuconolactone decarboxylase family protein [Legionella]|uniref:Putative Carboxymuconolactone decarboxylase n=1 Tax=Legionella drozanskii LLAP-1 TaxID=1212489 RepID=A0A0W0SVL1_9GAMM|nr:MULTISPECIES: carboxymuconolactone decarboxylase family protein [Legionella]KTC87416.1 putative Carboxymuconolactone decarboxylase [Legionella drozanskii LLAP-1]PJE08504.1 MAG: carboxymuconolactone decarboxylase family protein [Legionella sp.]